MIIKPLRKTECRISNKSGKAYYCEDRLKHLFKELLKRYPYVQYKWEMSESVRWNAQRLKVHDFTHNKIRSDICELFEPLVK